MFKTKQQLLKLKHILTNRVSASVVVSTNSINDTFRVKALGALLSVILRLSEVIGLKVSAYKVRVILAFLRKCAYLYRHRGMKGLVNYLKACSVLFQQSLGGMRLHDTSELKCRVSRTKYGLPRVIDRNWRFQVRVREDVLIMRLIMTMLALYRVLEFPGKLKLATITDGFKGDLQPNSKYWAVVHHIPNFVKLIREIQRGNRVLPLQERGIAPRPIVKSAPGTAGPQISTSPFALLLSARAYVHHGLKDALEFFIKYFEKGTKIPFPGLMGIFQGAALLPLDIIPSMGNVPLGRLALKHEPAGKIRVFAMCDAWTQWVLEPLHDWLFDTLRFIETDGTFDQMKPVISKVNKFPCAFSLDLSAATDRLPIALQVELLRVLIDKDFAITWSRLLVGRDYFLPSNTKLGIEAQSLRYSVGQPMGALSSWAMLAITHHLLVQVSAWEAGYDIKKWYTGYAVLGDDLVIFDPKVKTQYLHIVDAIGVECGIAKSLLARTKSVVEFAKRTLYKGVDISPISFTEFLSALYYLPDAITFARKYHLTFPQLLKALGYGYRVRSTVFKHVGRLNSRVRALMFAYHLPDSEEAATSMFLKGNPFLTEAQLEMVISEFKSVMVSKYLDRIQSRLKAYPSTPTVIKQQVDATADMVMQRLAFMPFLKTLLERILPNQGVTEISTHVEQWEPFFDFTAKEFKDAFGFKPKGFRIPSVTDMGQDPNRVMEVPPALYNKIQAFKQNLILVLTRIVKIVVEAPRKDFREKAKKLTYTLHAIHYKRTPLTVYTAILTQLRALNRAGTGEVHFERPVEGKLKHGVDAVQLQLWREFTSVLLRVLPKITKERKV
nr:putative RNA-dependent RNA polymerase [Binucleate Rhizoctonia mitovirus 7]